MKKSYAIAAAAIFLGLVIAATVYAKVMNFAWDANTEPDLAEYKLYCGQTTGGPYSFVKTVPAPGTTTGFDFTVDGTYFCVLTALDTVGNESGHSNEVTFRIDQTPPAAPKNFRLAQ